MTTEPTYEAALAKLDHNHWKARKMLSDHAPLFALAREISRAWPGDDVRVCFDVPEGMSIGGVKVLVYMEAQHTFRDLAPLVEIAEGHGLELVATDDYPEIKRRTFRFKDERRKTLSWYDSSGKLKQPITFVLMAFAHEKSVCTLVQVGTEPKYEMRCGEAA